MRSDYQQGQQITPWEVLENSDGAAVGLPEDERLTGEWECATGQENGYYAADSTAVRVNI